MESLCEKIIRRYLINIKKAISKQFGESQITVVTTCLALLASNIVQHYLNTMWFLRAEQ